jgi:hypothetical protein
MKCRICDAKLEQKWLFCPYCGSRKTSSPNKGFEKVFQVLEKGFRDLLGTDLPLGKGFMVEISEDKDTPKVSVRKLNKGIKTSRGSVVLEPQVIMKEGGRVMQVHLPNVKAQRDISIKKFHSSVEVKARAGNKVYFAIIPLKYRNMVKQEFSNGLLTLRFT